ncbi:MAG: SRPBCC family protein [Ferruginibacter sp.]
MKTKTKSILIHSTPDKVFAQMDDFSKTGMHMSESSMMMMGSKLKLEQLSTNATGIGASYRWYGKMMGMIMDFSETVTKWQSPNIKEWETVGEAKIIIMSWYRMWFEIIPDEKGTSAKLSISYLPPKQWYYKVLSFVFANWYCNWCLNNMLIDTKKDLEKQPTD